MIYIYIYLILIELRQFLTKTLERFHFYGRMTWNSHDDDGTETTMNISFKNDCVFCGPYVILNQLSFIVKVSHRLINRGYW